MLTLIGIAAVTLSVVVGFALAGGPLALLLQPVELLMIVGSAVGTLLIMTPPSVFRRMVRQIVGTTRPSPFGSALYLDSLQLLYELLVKAKKHGLIALEKDVTHPEESPIFTAHPAFLRCEPAAEFLCEALRMLVDGALRPDDFEAVLDSRLETHHEEEGKPAAILQKVGDALPGLGIVVAVLGIIITMQHVDAGAAEVGQYVAVALVGTFLGVGLSYGYVQPLAANLEAQAAASSRFLLCLKNALVAFARGAPPLVAIEVARHVIFDEERPTADALADACRAPVTEPS